VGQLFRYFQVLPAFNLLAVGRRPPHPAPEGVVWEYEQWREYELTCTDMNCRFLEKFPVGFLNFGSASGEEDAISREDGDRIIQISSSNNSDVKDSMELP